LLQVLQTLMKMDQLVDFRLVGGTAIALQIGHRKSVDIDLFSNRKVNLRTVSRAIASEFPNVKNITLTQTNVSVFLNGIRVEIYDDWQIPFQMDQVLAEGIRLAALEDLAALKLSAIIGRREKKDYIDLFFLFQRLGGKQLLSNFKHYEPLLSDKSVLFALTEVDTARDNNTPMPDMLLNVDWAEIKQLFIQESKSYFAGLTE